jgi:cellulose synthase operon protein C
MRNSRNALWWLSAALLAGCASKHGTPDNVPTLKTLAGREAMVAPDGGIQGNEEQAIAAYRRFLQLSPNAPQRPEAMRRLGDLEMASADTRSANGGTGVQDANGGAPDYRAAIASYNDYLKAYPKDPDNDRVLYQLARATEQAGQLEAALATLDWLLAQYPKTRYRDEAQFRRGEMLFSLRDYPKAEQAYATVLRGEADNPFQGRALYMQGWALFKQARLEDGLRSFFGVLDLKLAGEESDQGGKGQDDHLAHLSRADRELLEDTLRVTSLSLANLQGAASIPPYIDSPLRSAYEFRIYQQLGELYIKQDRSKDAADTFVAFTKAQPLHAQAPQMQARVIEIYERGGFANQALKAKKDYVSRYGIDSEFSRANPAGWEAAQPLLKTHLAELARHHHAAAQASKSSADYAEAVRWYRIVLKTFPADPTAAQSNFLLAELLFEDKQFADASREYEKAAYDFPVHAKSADAGYAALLAYAEQEKTAVATTAKAATALPALQRSSVDSALRFAAAFESDPRAASVLTHAAEKLYALQDGEQAATVAQHVLTLQPPATPAQRRTAWTVLAHTAFERGEFGQAERAYVEVLALLPAQDAARNDMVERLAASVYRQGERARDAGLARDAVAHFARVATVAPQSAVRANAQYDAAAALIGLKDWDGAARTLEDFRQRYPNHALQAEVGNKLTVAYLEQQRWAPAAAELERLAASQTDPQIARTSLWQAAELYDKAGSRAAAAKAYGQYVARFALPLEPAIEARWRMAGIAKAEAQPAREMALMQDVLHADQGGGEARSPRTRYLGGMAALALAAPVFESYRKVELVEPLAKQLKLKKSRLEEVLKAYALAAEYGVAEVSTAATFQVASLYQDFGHALMNSQRPKKLSKKELEQYDLMLEEQAFPFEEKAIELHELNARRAREGVYDDWVKRSFAALRELKPVRYAKNERVEGAIDAIR